MTNNKTTFEMVTVPAGEPSIEPLYIECKFTIESRGISGGDWEKNYGGARSDKRISFEGYATNELYKALMDAVREVARV